jgi:flagellar hook-associated protein 1 FlgK
MRVDDVSALPLSDGVTADPNDRVIGLDFSAGAASVVSQINAALGGVVPQFSNPSGTTLRILDNGAGGNVAITAVSATVTQTALAGGALELPLFVDGNTVYTGAVRSSGAQSIGLAARVRVNPAVLADPSRLVVFQTSPPTAAGDGSRPDFILDRINNAVLEFSPRSGIGTSIAPFSGSLSAFMRQMISQQGDAAQAAASLKEGQDVVVGSLQQRFDEDASINIDEEMATLLNLQTAYAANARVLSTVKEMLDLLMGL